MKLLLSVGVLWSVGVWSLCVVTCDQQPVLTPGNHGDLHVLVPGIAGAVSVTVTLTSADLPDSNHKPATSSILITTPSVDGNWRATAHDVSGGNGDIHYVIEYQFPTGVHAVRGSQSLSHTETAVGQSLSSKRYLTRRATTVLYDDFSSGHIDPHKWSHVITAGEWASGVQAMMYTPEPVNSYVRNGVLHIRPTYTVDHFGSDFMYHSNLSARAQWGSCTSSGGLCQTYGWIYKNLQDYIPVTMSARLHSQAHIRYGKVEIVAKPAKGDWLWNSLWLMPTLPTAYGGWPTSGEIDILEVAGNRHLTSNITRTYSYGVDLARSSLHLGVDRTQDSHHQGNYHLPGATFGDAFHTYWLDWTEDLIRIGVDDHTILHVPTPSDGFYNADHMHGPNVWANGGKNAPFDKPFFLILNLSVMGRSFSGQVLNHPYDRPWNPDHEDAMFEFWHARHLWQPTWQWESASLQIKSVKMQQY